MNLLRDIFVLLIEITLDDTSHPNFRFINHGFPECVSIKKNMYQALKGRYLSEARIIRFVKGLGTRIINDVMTDTTGSFER
mgnify:FL=1